ncbi:hypothetical protein SEA_EVAA_46 [Gordonia phage Evaa]|nr:hypothetical protein SEA_EVAA_46 [Gordonia phage Evaa]
MASTLTFRTADLVTAAQSLIDNHDKLCREWDAKAETYLAQVTKAWTDKGGFEDIRDLRDVLTAALKRRSPVTATEVRALLVKKRGRSIGNTLENVFCTEISDFQMNRDLGHRPDPLKVTEYRALIGVLSAHTEPTITAAQLKAAGFDKIADLYRTVARLGLDNT